MCLPLPAVKPMDSTSTSDSKRMAKASPWSTRGEPFPLIPNPSASRIPSPPLVDTKKVIGRARAMAFSNQIRNAFLGQIPQIDDLPYCGGAAQ